VVGIPYSTSQQVSDTLVDKGYDVRVPPLDLEAWYQEVKASMEERIASAKKSGKRILVMDDGGLVAMMFERYPELAQEAHRFTIVEQTTRGITVADGIELKSSVISVAESWGKFVEGPMIGDKLGVKLEARLRGIGVQDLKGKHVGLTGYGTIGEPLARELQARGAIVTILDTDDNALLAAAKAGFKTARAAPGKERQGFFEHNDIIIGASGKRSIFKDDLAHLKKGPSWAAPPASWSRSRSRPSAAAPRGAERVVDSTTFPPTVRYSLKDGREVTLLASGYPLNFDGDVISIEPEKIQLTMGLLLIGALQAIRTKAAGVHRLDPEKQLEVLREFEEVGGVLASGEKVAAAKAIAMSKLEEMKLRHGSPADRRHRRAER
jgi:S-adenosylhomocysteine hydrolase